LPFFADSNPGEGVASGNQTLGFAAKRTLNHGVHRGGLMLVGSGPARANGNLWLMNGKVSFAAL
jgi:hypothetical protein